ncbi:hypothetical protein [Sorangium sp. So ce233]|uniref:hypothetical protein n=1 Tax=Sorangium sp. So ce233 TaxID=3133290 RepID=UPI003F62B0FA
MAERVGFSTGKPMAELGGVRGDDLAASQLEFAIEQVRRALQLLETAGGLPDRLQVKLFLDEPCVDEARARAAHRAAHSFACQVGRAVLELQSVVATVGAVSKEAEKAEDAWGALVLRHNLRQVAELTVPPGASSDASLT